MFWQTLSCGGGREAANLKGDAELGGSGGKGDSTNLKCNGGGPLGRNHGHYTN